MSRATGRFTVLHLSDVHATESGELYGAVDGLARLRSVSDYATEAGITPEVVLITGDLVQRENPGAYAAFELACRRLEHELGAPVLTVLGNHDDPVAARTLTGHETSHFGVTFIEDFRIVRLDSHTGSLGGEQLAWLADTIRAPYGRGTIIAIHHAPLDSPLPALRKQGLRDADELLRVLRGSDVRALLAGHFHHPLSATADDIPVFVGPSLAYHQVMDADPNSVAGHDSPMFSLVRLTSHEVSVATVSLCEPQPLFRKPLTSAASASASAALTER